MKIILVLIFFHFLSNLNAYEKKTTKKDLELEGFILGIKHLEDGPLRPMEAPFNSVTGKYGQLIIQEGKFTAESKKKPWSSWWYPLWERDTFERTDGNLSTLERYDEVARYFTGERYFSARIHEEKFYKGRASEWEGLCDAWALTSILEDEPIRNIREGGVTLRVRDLKFLLLKTYEKHQKMAFFGQRNNAEYDSVYEDIYPEEMHRFLQEELFKNKKAFIMDYDAGIQVWNVPVYKAKTIIKKDPNRPKVVQVKTYFFYASPFVDTKDFVGIEEVIKSYKYEFIGHWLGDKFYVDYGIWKESSRWDHPDYLMAVPKRKDIIRGSKNQEIDHRIVDELLRFAI